MTQNNVRTAAVPDKAPELLFRSLGNHSKTVPIIKFYNDVGFAVLYKLDHAFIIALNTKQINKIAVIL